MRTTIEISDELLRELAEGQASWAIPWPCVYESLTVDRDFSRFPGLRVRNPFQEVNP